MSSGKPAHLPPTPAKRETEGHQDIEAATKKAEKASAECLEIATQEKLCKTALGLHIQRPRFYSYIYYLHKLPLNNCKRLTLTLLVLNKVTNQHTGLTRVNAVSGTGGTKAVGCWRVHPARGAPGGCAGSSSRVLDRTTPLMPPQTRIMPTRAGK